MFWSKAFIPTLREIPQEAESRAHQLILRAGLTRMLVAGVYSYLPLGLRVLHNIEEIIRQEMNRCGAQELLLPALQPQELWDISGRNKQMEEIMIRFVDRRGRKMCLGPTHEEVITALVSANVNSYKQLPLILYQIQTKFRDEIRPRFGLVRSCEFIMKDAYSFDVDKDGLDRNYNSMYEAYVKIFKRCALDCVITEADPGVMGGDVSHEFMVLADSGEDTVFICKECSYSAAIKGKHCPKCNAGAMEEKKAIEIGHTFKLQTKYSEVLSAMFTNGSGLRQPVIMGCYGIGVSRLLAAVIESHNDGDGIIWPEEISPYDCIIMPLNISDAAAKSCALDLYEKLESAGVEVLLDDRDERAGVKFKDADLIGIPWRIVIGPQALERKEIELQNRLSKESKMITLKDAPDKLVSILTNRERGCKRSYNF